MHFYNKEDVNRAAVIEKRHSTGSSPELMQMLKSKYMQNTKDTAHARLGVI